MPKRIDPRIFTVARGVLVVLVLACPAPDARAQADEDFVTPQDLAGRTVREIRVTGNERVARERIVAALTQAMGEPFRPGEVPEDLRRVFALEQFSDVQILVEPVEGGVAYVVRVVERPVVARVRIVGESQLREQEIEPVVGIEAGEVVRAADPQRAARRIEKLYSERGFALTEVEASTVPAGTGRVDVVLSIAEKPRVRIAELELVGVAEERAERLRQAIALRETSLFTRITGTSVYTFERMERALETLEAFYFDRGFVQARIEPQVELFDEQRKARITFRIEEGRPHRIATLGFEGQTVLGEQELRALTSSEPGELIDRSRVVRDVEAITLRLQNLGYACATVIPGFDRREDADEVDLRFRIEPGEQVAIGEIQIGETDTREAVIRRELEVEPGARFTAEAVRRSVDRLRVTGLFDQVDVARAGPCEDGEVDLRVSVKDARTLGYQLSFGFSTDEQVVGTVLLIERNLFGTGRAASLQGQLSSLRSTAAASYLEPYLFASPGDLSLEGSWSRLEYPDFTRRGAGGSGNYRFQFGRLSAPLQGLTAIAAYTYQQVDIFDAPPLSPVLAPFFTGGRISALALTVGWEVPELLQVTPRGRFALASVEVSPELLGAETRFVRLAGVLRWSFPLVSGSLLRTRLQTGWVDPLGDQVLPVSERFFLGGFDSLRGYRYRSISPTILAPDASGALVPVDIGGTAQLLFGFELELPIVARFRLNAVAFIDAGNVFLDGDPAEQGRDSPLGLLYSTGFGLRWFSPAGLLRVELAFPLNPRPGDPPAVLELGAGVLP